MAGIIPSQDPEDSCHHLMPNYIELNQRLKNLVNREEFKSKSSYLDIPTEFSSISANNYSGDLVHLSPIGARHLACFIKEHVVGLLDEL